MALRIAGLFASRRARAQYTRADVCSHTYFELSRRCRCNEICFCSKRPCNDRPQHHIGLSCNHPAARSKLKRLAGQQRGHLFHPIQTWGTLHPVVTRQPQLNRSIKSAPTPPCHCASPMNWFKYHRGCKSLPPTRQSGSILRAILGPPLG